MRTFHILAVIVLAITLAILILPDGHSKAREDVLEFVRHWQANDSQKVIEAMYFVSTVAESSAVATLPGVSWESFVEVTTKGEWGKLETLVGKMEAERLAGKFAIPVDSLWAFADEGKYVALYQTANSTGEAQWKIVSCRFSSWQQADINVHYQEQIYWFLGIENGFLVVRHDGKPIFLPFLHRNEDNYTLPVAEDLVVVEDKPATSQQEQLRRIVVELQYDVEPETPTWELQLRANGETTTITTDEESVKPGSYQYQLLVAGYAPQTGELKILSGSSPYYIKRQLQSIPRDFVVSCFDPDQQMLVADEVLVDGEEISNTISPGKRTVVVRKEGYKEESQSLDIKASAMAMILRVTLHPQDRSVRFRFVDKHNGKVLVPEDFLIAGRKANSDEIQQLAPGKHSIVAGSPGYEKFARDIIIPLGTGEHLVEASLTPQSTCRVVSQIGYGVMPAYLDESPQVTLVRESDKQAIEVDGSTKIAPGKYQVTVRRSGYQTHQDTIEVRSREAVVYIRHMLQPEPRTLQIHVTTKYPTPQTLEPDKIVVNGQVVEGTTQVTPGKCVIEISKDGYSPIRKEITIPADTSPLALSYAMVAGSRPVRFVFLDEKSQQRVPKVNATVDGHKVGDSGIVSLKPGEYVLKVIAQGYLPLQSQIDIPVGSALHNLPIMLQPAQQDTTKARAISFQFIAEQGIIDVEPHEILVNHHRYEGEEKYPVGDFVKIFIKFHQYESYYQEIEIARGEGKMAISIPLKPLKKHALYLPSDRFVLDGLDYAYGFLVNGELVESHLIQMTKKDEKYLVEISVPQKANTLRIHAGYYLYELSLAEDTVEHPQDITFEKISLPHWRGHVMRVKKELGVDSALFVLQLFLQRESNQKFLRENMPREELEGFIEIVQGWQTQQGDLFASVVTLLRELVK